MKESQQWRGAEQKIKRREVLEFISGLSSATLGLAVLEHPISACCLTAVLLMPKTKLLFPSLLDIYFITNCNTCGLEFYPGLHCHCFCHFNVYPSSQCVQPGDFFNARLYSATCTVCCMYYNSSKRVRYVNEQTTN